MGRTASGRRAARPDSCTLPPVLVPASLRLRAVPRPVLVASVGASWAVALLAAVAGWPLWAAALATLAPWLPPFLLQVVSTGRQYHWLALFYVVAVAQSGHFAEHVVQVVQVRALQLSPEEAHGIVGVFDTEWMHFGWNNAVALLLLGLLTRYQRNPWLWLTTGIAAWHAAEHVAIIVPFLTAGVRGAPGLLGTGGLLRGGLPLAATDLHFFYNLLETVPLLAAFLHECSRAYEQRARSEAQAAVREARTQERLAHLKRLRW